MASKNVLVNDILSFISCHLKKVPNSQVIKVLGDYYSADDIKKAHKLLLDSLVSQKSTRHARRVKNPDPAAAICECFQHIKSEDLPMFVCRNLNNIPQISDSENLANIKIKKEMTDNEEMLEELEDSSDLSEFKQEQQCMKDQLSGIASIVREVKQHMDKLTKKPSRFTNKIQNPSKKYKESQSSQDLQKNDKGLALLQKLIDEEAIKADMGENESYQEEDEMENDVEDPFFDSDAEGSYVEGATIVEDGSFAGFGNNEEQVVIYQNEGQMGLKEKVIHITQSDARSDHRGGIEISDVPGNFVELQTVSEGTSEIILESRSGTENYIIDNNIPLPPQNAKKDQGFSCPLCGAPFDSEVKLVHHLVTHRTGSPLTCYICSFTCVNARVMKKHLTENHPDKIVGIKKKLIYKCTFCGFECHSKQLIQAHIEHHYEEKGPNCFECQECQEIFPSRQLISKHKKIAHESACPFVCDICGARFALKVYLKTHKKTHGGDKPYACQFCDHKFANRSKLILHERTHTGERPFKCNHCEYRSSRTDNLKYHIKSKHIGHSIRKCPRCDVKFRREDLERHLQLHSTESPYQCLDCNRLFKSLGGLRVHYKSSQVHLKAHAATAMTHMGLEKENGI